MVDYFFSRCEIPRATRDPAPQDPVIRAWRRMRAGERRYLSPSRPRMGDKAMFTDLDVADGKMRCSIFYQSVDELN